jgi:CheY-like chemotaxis protein/HPt (histidine-containing phosphotransfer) domain-containing protein
MAGKKQKILIVEDMPANIQILHETLKEEYEVYFALNGKDALRNASTVMPDLILLDIMMPEMDGYEVCGALKNNALLKDIPVIFITALDQAEHEVKGLELGAVDYITKPFNPGIVRLRIHNHLELKKHRDTLVLKNAELQAALAKIKTLCGLLPICASCKKIRDDKGYWNQIEAYISDHSEAEFSHGVCPECAKKLYPEFYDDLYPERKPPPELRILLAEDNGINRAVALKQLQKLGYSADTVTNGLEVLEALRRIPYDVILMDCQMPEMDGFETTRIIRLRERQSQQRPVHIIAMTAHTTEEDRDRCTAVGMEDYLGKPVEQADLQTALERCIRTRSRSDQTERVDLSQPGENKAEGGEAEEPAPGEPTVDIERLKEISDGSPERLRELIGLYFSQAEELIIGTGAAIAAGSPKEVTRLAHKLAGSSLSCGMTAIVPSLQELEQQGKQGRLSEADRLLAEAKEKLKSIRLRLSDYLADFQGMKE